MKPKKNLRRNKIVKKVNNTLKKTDHNKYEVTVELGREELSGYLKKTEDRIVSETQIDGFRPGKAPKDLIRKKVGDKHILERALDIAVQDSLAKTLDEQQLEVIKVSDLDIKENSASKLIYTINVTIFPPIELPTLSQIKVKRKDVEVEPKDIENTMDFLRSSRSKFLPKKGPVEKGDRVEVDFEVTSDGLPVEGGVSKNHPVIVGENKFIPGFEEQLIGMEKDGEKKFSLKAPADYFHKSVAGKELDFSVKIISVQIIEKPVLNDEFAQSLGKFSNLNELEDNIKNGLTEEKKEKERQRLRLEILTRIFENSKVELPADMIEEKLNQMIVGFDNDLHAKGMELSFYLAHLGKTEDDLKKDWRPEAEKQVAFALILRKLAKVNNLYPSKEEIDERVDQAMQTLAVNGQFNPETVNLEGVRDAVAADMTNEKVFSFLETNCIAA